jgi:hypothetical protein
MCYKDDRIIAIQIAVIRYSTCFILQEIKENLGKNVDLFICPYYIYDVFRTVFSVNDCVVNSASLFYLFEKLIFSMTFFYIL